MLWIFVTTLVVFGHVAATSDLSKPKCVPITVPICKTPYSQFSNVTMYNMTTYPNSLTHRNQEEAGLEVHQFFPLVKVQCSKYLQLFLCSIYTPICSKPLVLPCRSLCEVARAGCIQLMNSFGFVWPDYLKCEKYPKEEDGICIGAPVTKKAKEVKHCTPCVDSSPSTLKALCQTHDLVFVGKVVNMRGNKSFKFQVKKQIKTANLGKVMRKKLRKNKMMVKVHASKKLCKSCAKFENKKQYVVFIKIKKGKRAIYSLPGVVPYTVGMKVC